MRLPSTVVALLPVLVVQALPVCAQPPCPVATLQVPTLQLGIDDGEQWNWICPTDAFPLDTNQSIGGRVRFHGRKGGWFRVMVKTYVEDAENPGSPAEQAFFAAHPQYDPVLRKRTPYAASTVFPSQDWTGQNLLVVAPSVFLPAINGALVNPITQGLDEGIVRCSFQPAVAEDPLDPLLGFREWNVRAPVWLHESTNIPPLYNYSWDPAKPGFGECWSNFWWPYALDAAGDTTILSWHALMALGVFLEMPRSLAAGFLNTELLYEAASIGLYIHIQGVGAISTDPAFQAMLNEIHNPGLSGINPPPGMPFCPPTTTITNPVTVRVSLGQPLMCGSCGGSGGPVTTAGNAGSAMLVRGMNLYAPSRLVFPQSLSSGASGITNASGASSASGTASASATANASASIFATSPPAALLIPDAAIDDPLRSRYAVPLNAPTGTHWVRAENAAGLVKNNFLLVTVNPITSATLFPSAGF